MMSKKWQLQEAKNSFSEVVNEALVNGPQIVTRHGEDTVVIMSMLDYKKKVREGKSLHEILSSFPKNTDIDVTRNKSTKTRDIQL